MCFDRAGQLIVCDFGNLRVQVLTKHGGFVSSFGDFERLMARRRLFAQCRVMCVYEGKILVGFMNCRVRVFGFVG